MTNCFRSNACYRVFFVLYRNCNNYSRVIDLFSNFSRTCRQQKLAFVCKNNLLYIRVLDYIETVEKIISTKQIDVSKIAIVKQSLFSNTQSYSALNI